MTASRAAALGGRRDAWAIVLAVAIVLSLAAGIVPLGPNPGPSGSAAGRVAGSHVDSRSLSTPAGSPLTAGTPVPSMPRLDPGQSVELNASVSGGTPTYHYQWYSGTYPQCAGDTNPAGTGASLNASSAAGDLYYCYNVTDSGTPVPAWAEPATAALVNVSLSSLQANPVTPSDPAVDNGTSLTLTSHPSGGTSPYTVAWFASTTGTSSCTITQVGTGSTLTVKPQKNTTYCYEAFDSSVGRPAASAFSASDLVVVEPALSAGPVTPHAPAIDAGQSLTLAAAPSGGTGHGTYTVKWYAGTSSVCPTGMTGVGTNSTTFTASPTASQDSFCYSVTDGAYLSPTIYSATDTVALNAALSAGAVTPGSPGIDFGQNLTLSAAATGGTGNLSYQWYYSDYASCSGASPFTGQTNRTFTETPGLIVEYICYSVTDSAFVPVTQFSPGDLVQVNPRLGGGSPSPVSATIDNGSSVKLTANPTGGTSPYTVTWFSGPSSTCAGDTTSAGTGSSIQAAPKATTFYCYEVTDSSKGSPAAGAYSATAQVNVNLPLTAGSITPAAPTIDSGQTITLSANASGGTPVWTYQWFSGTSATCASDSVISGQTGATYRASPTASTYYCYSASDGSSDPPTVRSPTVQVSVNPTLKAGAVKPATPVIDRGQWILLTAVPTGGTAPYTYQWYAGSSQTCSSDTTLLGTGVNQNVSPAVSTYYCYRVADSAPTPENASSATNEITVDAPLVAGAVTSNATVIDKTQTAVLTAKASGGAPTLHYQWYSGTSSNCSLDKAVHGATSVTFSIQPTSTSEFCYVLTDSSGGSPAASAMSGTYLVTVNPTLQNRGITPSNPSIMSGQSVLLTGNTTGGTPPIKMHWLVSSSRNCSNGTLIAGATGSTYNASPSSTTYYCFVVTDASTGSPAGVNTSQPDQVTVNYPPPPSFLGFPVDVGYSLLGALIAICALIGYAIVRAARRSRGRRGAADNFL